jgi:hypothetical protein
VRRGEAALPGDYFDLVTVAFGLRNMTHKELALAEMRRVLKPGGKLMVLEFSKVWKPLQPLYDLYSFQMLPRMGDLVTKDADSYRYLAESIRMHPDQETLKGMMESRPAWASPRCCRTSAWVRKWPACCMILAAGDGAVFVVRWLMSKRSPQPACSMPAAGARQCRAGELQPCAIRSLKVPGGTHSAGAGATAAPWPQHPGRFRRRRLPAPGQAEFRAPAGGQ